MLNDFLGLFTNSPLDGLNGTPPGPGHNPAYAPVIPVPGVNKGGITIVPINGGTQLPPTSTGQPLPGQPSTGSDPSGGLGGVISPPNLSAPGTLTPTGGTLNKALIFMVLTSILFIGLYGTVLPDSTKQVIESGIKSTIKDATEGAIFA